MGLQFRRGTDSDRLGVTPDIGEPLFTTDNNKLYIGDGLTAGGILVSGTISDSGDVTSIINETVDSAYIQARQADIFRDSAFVTNIVDTAYIQARDRIRDSGFVEDIVDSAFVQARQDYAYNSLTGTPTLLSQFDNDTNYLDSTTVTGVIDASYIQSNQTTYDFLDSAEVIGLVDSSYVQARQTPQDFAYSSLTGAPTTVSSFTNDANYLDSTTVTGVIDTAYVQSNQITYDTSDFVDSAYVATQISNLIDGAPVALDTLNEIAIALQDDSDALAALVTVVDTKLNTAGVTSLVDSAYVQARQILQDFAYSSLTGAPTNLSQFNNDTNYLDSTTVTGVIDATYIQANQTTYDFLDSSEVIGLIDSAYINLRTDANIDSAALIALVDSAYVQARQAPGTDSAEVQNIIIGFADSAYVQARQDFAYSSLIGAPNVLDSNDVAELLPDGTFRGLRTYTFTADSGDTIFSGTDDNGNSLTYSSNSLVVYANGILLVPTVDYTATNGSSITLAIAADSADVITAHNIVAGGTDSALINQEILGLIDSAYVQARQVDLQRDSAFITNIVDSAYVQLRQTPQDFAYSSLTGAPTTVSSFTNDANYLDSTTVTGVIDATYIQANQTTYDFLDSAEAIALIDSAYVQARQSNADQDLNTTDSVTFATLNVTGNTIIGGNLQVNGTTVTVNSEDLSVTDNMIYMNAGESAGSPTASIDVGWAANVNDDGSYAHVGMFRDATDNTFKVYEGYTPEPDAAVQINTAHASFSLAPFAARTLTGEYLGFDSDVTAAGLATQSYVTTTIDSAYVQLRQTPQDFAYSSLTGAPTTVSTFTNDANYLDSTTVTGVIDSAYVNARVSATDSAAVISIVTGTIDSAYINARVDAGTDSAATIALITATVDSAYVALREANASGGLDSAAVLSIIPDATLQGVNQFEFIGDSGQTVFTGNDRDGNGLIYNATDVLVFLNGTLMVPGNDFVTTNSSTITFTEGVDSGDFVNIFNFTAGRAVGGGVSEVNNFDFSADSGQTIFTGTDANGSTLSFIGNDNIQVFINGILLKQSDYTTLNNNTITLLDPADSADEVRIIAYDTYSQRVAIDAYNFTADSGQTIFTGTDDDGNALSFAPGNLQVHLNGIMLRSGNDYSTTGSGTVTLVSGADSGDTLTVTAISGDSAGYQTIVTGLIDSAYINARVDAGVDSASVLSIVTADRFTKYDSADTLGLIDSAYIQARQDFAYSSLTGAPTAVSTFTNDANYLDSTTVTNVINAAYIQANQTTYSTADFVDSAYVATQISNLVDGAPTALDTLNELATALQNDSDALAALITVVDTKLNTSQVTSLVDSAYVQARQTTYDFLDSAEAIALIATQGYLTNALDSAEVISVITGSDLDMGTNKILYSNVYDSTGALPTASSYHGMFAHVHATGAAYFAHAGSWIQLANNSDIPTIPSTISSFTNDVGYTTYDSTNTLGLIDSAYINARVDAVAGTDSAATIALIQATVDSAYVAAREANIGGGGADSATILALIQATVDSAYVAARDPGGAGGVTFRNYEYTADSGQTVFSGADALGNSLAYTPNQLQVYRNGILLIDSADYTAESSSTVTLATASETGDNITIATYTATVGATINTYDYFADSGQTSFSGVDIDGNTLSFTGSNVLVHVNGLLLTDSNDYTRVGGSTITFDAGLDSGDIVSIIAISDLASEGGTDSAATIALIENTVDSAYIAARSAAGTDSATVENIIRSLVDSDYVFARQRSTTGLVFDAYSYTSDSAQTVFSGADNNNLTLHYNVGEIQVFRNGILLVDSDDYTASNGTSVILNSAAALNDNISIASFTSATNEIRMNEFEFTADSAQTIFIGIDDGGSTLSYNAGNILVHLNGILLSDSADYSAGNGTSITLNIGADSGDILHISSFSTPAETNLWREVTSTTYNITAGNKLIVDTSSSAVTVNLPTIASFGDEVKIIDGTGNAATNNITINRNGHKILASDSDFTIDVDRTAVDLVYYNTTNGWIISGNT